MNTDSFSLSCPIPITEYSNVLLAHGGGGKLTKHLIETMFASQFANEELAPLHDGAVLPILTDKLAFTTDSYVVHPLFFPGGDIGKLAVHGTVNDLSMCGAKPLYLSAAFIIEEGLPMDELWCVVCSMSEAAKESGVKIVTGDTKVVDKGKGDKLFITTSGVGELYAGVKIDPSKAKPGDVIILNGAIGLHGIAIMSMREGLEFTSPVLSDTVPLHGLVADMLKVSPHIRVLRDATRGGVATVLNEIADSSKIGIRIFEENIPVPQEVQGACELLGFDPLYIANEGKLVAVVPKEDAEQVLEVMRQHPYGKESVVIGEVVADHPKFVVMKSRIGGNRIVDMLSGEQLPRIC